MLRKRNTTFHINAEIEGCPDQEFYEKIDKMVEKILSPSKHCEIEDAEQTIYDQEGIGDENGIVK